MKVEIEIPDSFEVVTHGSAQGDETLVDIKLWGNLVQRRRYPFPVTSEYKVAAAITESKRAFATKLAELFELSYSGV